MQQSTNTSFRVIKGIGAGQFGTAFLVESNGSPGDVYCAKEIAFRGGVDAKREALQEVKLMRETCNHPNIVSYVDSWLENRPGQRSLVVLMEYCSNGSLDKLISKVAHKGDNFNEKRVMHYMQELSGALEYCHNDLHIVHRDLKPHNVLIDYTGSLKLADFGLAKLLDAGSDMCITYCGSPLYMSPEQCDGRTYSYPADMWGLGCILYELMSLNSPWRDPAYERVPVYNTIPETLRRIKAATPRYSHLRSLYPMPLIDLTRWLLQKDPEKRWTASQVCDILSMRSPPPSFPEGLSTTCVLEREEREDAMRDMAALLIQRSFRGGSSTLRKREQDTEVDDVIEEDGEEMLREKREEKRHAEGRHQKEDAKTLLNQKRMEMLHRPSHRPSPAPPPPVSKPVLHKQVLSPPFANPSHPSPTPNNNRKVGYTCAAPARNGARNPPLNKDGRVMSRIDALAQPRHQKKIPPVHTPLSRAIQPKHLPPPPPPPPPPAYPPSSCQPPPLHFIRPAWNP